MVNAENDGPDDFPFPTLRRDKHDILAVIPADAMALLRRHNLLRPLVQKQVIAEAVGNTELTPEERQQARSQFLKVNRLSDADAEQRFITSQGLSPSDLTWQIELPLRIQQHCRKHFLHKAEARFLSRKNQLDRVVYSLLRVRDGLLARELYLRIAGEEATFAELAARHAEGPEKSTHGIVGPVPLAQAHPMLMDKLRTSSPGVLLEPFSLENWWLVVRLEQYSPASFDQAMAMRMASELFEEWVRHETTRTLQSLTSEAESTVQP